MAMEKDSSQMISQAARRTSNRVAFHGADQVIESWQVFGQLQASIGYRFGIVACR